MQTALEVYFALLHGRQGRHQLRFQSLSITIAQFRWQSCDESLLLAHNTLEEYVDLEMQEKGFRRLPVFLGLCCIS